MEAMKSKKLIIGVVAAVGIVVNDLLGKPVSQDAMYSAIGMLATYILGQGLSDFGKEKAKVESDSKMSGPSWSDTTEVDEEDKPKDLNG